MPQKHFSHAIPFNPIDSGGRVDFRRIVIRQKSVALNSPGGHQNEYAKCRIGDCKTWRFGFRESAGEEVDAFDVAIDRCEFMPPLFVVRELAESSWARSSAACGETHNSGARRVPGRGGCRSPRGP